MQWWEAYEYILNGLPKKGNYYGCNKHTMYGLLLKSNNNLAMLNVAVNMDED